MAIWEGSACCGGMVEGCWSHAGRFCSDEVGGVPRPQNSSTNNIAVRY